MSYRSILLVTLIALTACETQPIAPVLERDASSPALFSSSPATAGLVVIDDFAGGPDGSWAGWFPSLYVYQAVGSVLGGARELRSYRSGKITIDGSAGTLEWGGTTVSPEYGLRYGLGIGTNWHPTKGANANAGLGTPLNLQLSLEAEVVLTLANVSQVHAQVDIWLYSGATNNWYVKGVTLTPGEVRVPLSSFSMPAAAAEDIDGLAVEGFAHLDAGTPGTGTVFTRVAVEAAAPPVTVFTSGSGVTTWNAIPATGPFSGYHDDGISRLCVANPAVGLDANWTNPHSAFAVGPAVFENWSGFNAQWINAWPSINAADIAPGGQHNPTFGSGYGTSSNTSLPGKNWTRYQTQVSGNGDFVLFLHADNCSWIYLSDENGNNPQMVGVQLNNNSGTYGVTLSGVHKLDFIIYDGGGQAGGKFRLETTTNPPPPLILDTSAPVIAATVAGTQGANGWYTSDVSVSWTVSDLESAVSSTEGCDTTNVTADTNGVTFTCTATSAGGTASESVTIKRDATAPTVSVALGGTLNNGWYNTDVTVTWTTGDNLSGVVSTTCADNTVTTDGTHSQECAVTDNAGNSATGSTGEFKRDATNPTVTYSGNAGSYDVAATVNITCTATDNLSGIASDSCADLSGAAYSFGLGSTSFSASAEDVAGNTGSASGSFQVTASLDGLCTLVQRFVTQRGVANSLCAKTTAADRARNTGARNGALGAFINEVEAQSGKHIDADEALILIMIANALIG